MRWALCLLLGLAGCRGSREVVDAGVTEQNPLIDLPLGPSVPVPSNWPAEVGADA